MASGVKQTFTNLTEGKVKGFGNGDESADQVSQSDKPIGPFPKSSKASLTAKDGGA